ncbi:MAG: UDP-N-acetylmuramate--L-alanine ligase [Bacteroidia bacterium]
MTPIFVNMKIHFIAIGGAIMHNLAIALHKKGHEVTGSDDIIFDPSKSRLEKHGLLPKDIGWNTNNITNNLDAIILGMHAKVDNPELLKAQEMGLKVSSFPEFVYEECKDKTRIVIAGSHGKTTTTSMVMHVLNEMGKDFDYMVGSSVDGFEDSVKLSDAPIVVLEGDEYLTSPIDLRPKFIWYKPQVLMITGIAWDHINVFPTFDGYVDQFRKLIEDQNHGALVYYVGDEHLDRIVNDQFKPDLFIKPYDTPNYKLNEGETEVEHDGLKTPLKIIGEHNLQNMEGARLVCEEIGISAEDFFKAMSTFEGAGRRLECLVNTPEYVLYKDFAHSPSKVTASVKAINDQFPALESVALLELHTFSSLKKEFLPHYANSLTPAKRAAVFINPETLKKKGNLSFAEKEIKEAFNREDLSFLQTPEELTDYLKTINKSGEAVIFMSSGNWGGVDVEAILS